MKAPQKFLPLSCFQLQNTDENHTIPCLWYEIYRIKGICRSVNQLHLCHIIKNRQRRIEQQKPDIRIIAVEPYDFPMLSGGQKSPYKIQEIGAGYIPLIGNRSVIDEINTAGKDDAFETSRILASHPGQHSTR